MIPHGKEQFLTGEVAAHCKVQAHFAVTYAKTAEPIVMAFGLRARTSPRNHELDGGPDPPHKKWQFCRKGSPIVKYRDFLP